MHDTECALCNAFMPYRCLLSCNHDLYCSLCLFRLRDKLNKRECPVCRTSSEFVFIVKSKERTYSDFATTLWGDSCVACPYYDDATGMYFESESEYSSLINLRKFICKICQDNLRKPNAFTSHCLSRHKLYICNLCLEYRNLYPTEQDLYTKEDLYKHISSEHKKCKLCNEQIFDDDHMTRHVREAHYACDLCPPGDRPYFLDYDELQQHYRRKHFLCEVTMCLVGKHVVFKTFEGLRIHYVTHHPRLEMPTVFASFKGTGEEEQNEVRIVDMNDKTFLCPEMDQEEEKREDFPALVRNNKKDEKKNNWKTAKKQKTHTDQEPTHWPSLPVNESVPKSKVAKNALPSKNSQFDPLSFREIPVSKSRNNIKASLRDIKLHKKNAWGEGPPDIPSPKKHTIKLINQGTLENTKTEEFPESKLKKPPNDRESRIREERESLKDMINLYKAQGIMVSELENYCRNLNELSMTDILTMLKDNLSKKMNKRISGILDPKPKPKLIINPEPPKQIPIQPNQIPIQSYQIPIQSYQIPIQPNQIPIQPNQIPIQPKQTQTPGKIEEGDVWSDFYMEVVEDLVYNLRSKSMSVKNFIDRIKELIPYPLLSQAREYVKARIDINTVSTLKKELEKLLQQPKNPADFPNLPGFNVADSANAWRYELRDQINLYNKGILSKEGFISNVESILPESSRNSAYQTIRQFIKDKIMADILVQSLINNSLHSTLHDGFPKLSTADSVPPLTPQPKKKKGKWSVRLKL